MQHRHGLATEFQPLVIEAIAAVVRLQTGDQVLAHAFLLEPQGHYRIGPRQGILQAPFQAHAAPLGNGIGPLARRWGRHEVSKALGQQGGRSAEHHLGPTGAERPEVGAGHPRMQHIAHDHDAFAP